MSFVIYTHARLQTNKKKILFYQFIHNNKLSIYCYNNYVIFKLCVSHLNDVMSLMLYSW